MRIRTCDSTRGTHNTELETAEYFVDTKDKYNTKSVDFCQECFRLWMLERLQYLKSMPKDTTYSFGRIAK
jgi:hypothetical protein